MSLKINNDPTPSGMEVDSQSISVATTATTTSLAPVTTPFVDSTYGSLVSSGDNNVVTAHASGDIMSLTTPIVAGGAGRRRVDQLMPSVPLGDFLKRNVLVASVSDFTVPFTFAPWYEWSANPFVLDKVKNFAYLSGSMKVKGVIKAPPMTSGLLAVSFYPSVARTSLAVGVHPKLSLVVDHVLVDISNSTDFEIELPWIFPSNWAELTSTYGGGDYRYSWTVTVNPLAPITSSVPDGVAATTLKLYCVPGDDFELTGPVYQGKKRTSVNMAKAASGSSARGKFSTIADRVSQAAGVAATFPSLAPFAAPVMGAAAGVAKVLDMFGLTRETVMEDPEVALLKPASNLLYCDGVDSGRTTSLFSANAISIDPAASGTLSDVDEATFAHIGSRYTLVNTIEYTVGDPAPPDFILPVTPFYAPEIAVNKLLPTTAGYLGARFAFWRGDIKYLIYPVVSAVHRGALQFIWQPDTVPGPNGVDYTNISLNSIVDVGCAQPIEVNVGYASHLPMLSNKIYSDRSIAFSDRNYINGHLRIRNIVPFTGSKAGETIRVLIFQAAGENMEFAKPTDQILVDDTIRSFGADLDIEVLLESGTVGADGQSVTRVELVPSSGTYPVAENLSGETVRSVRAMIQKPSIQGKWQYAVGTNGIGTHRHSPMQGSPANYFKYYGSMFLGFCGSIRYKIVIDRSVSSDDGNRPFPFVSRMIPYVTSSGLGAGGCLTEVNPTVAGDFYGVEYAVPSYFNQLYHSAYNSLSAPADYIQFPSPFPTTRTITAQLYRSAGHDARLTYFRAQSAITVGPVEAYKSIPTPFNPFSEVSITGVP